jgi:hypothetical protein
MFEGGRGSAVIGVICGEFSHLVSFDPFAKNKK